MSKKKLQHFAEIAAFENVIQLPYQTLTKECTLKGKWASDYFGNNNPVVLELACGKGEYTLGLAELYPENNYIGIDIKGARIWRGAKTALEKKLSNVAFVRTQIGLIEDIFDENEISEIWLTFPDPQPKKINIKKRLTAPAFLNRYKNILNKDGIIHLKTDNTNLFDYTLTVIAEENHSLLMQVKDVYNSSLSGVVTSIKTFYENKFIAEGLPIHYLKFRLNN